MFFHCKITTTVNITQYVLKTLCNSYSRYTIKAMELDVVQMEVMLVTASQCYLCINKFNFMHSNKVKLNYHI